MPWQLLVISAVAVTAICMLAALLSMRKVLWLEPAMVFKG
jgi:putative ABC transport system permease protein